MEQLAAQQRREMEAKTQEQITRAIQDHMSRSAASATPDLHQMFVTQGRQLHLLTRMMMKQIKTQDQSPSGQTSTGKRSPEETSTLTEGMDDGSDLSDAELLHTPEVRKRVDLKRTPQKSASTRTEATTPSPHHADPHMWTPDSVSTVYPDHPNHPVHIGGDGPSDNEHESDTVMTGPRFSPFHSSESGALEDDYITPTQLEDIYLQHDESNRVTDSSQQEADPRTESRADLHSPTQEDKTQPSQAKPVEEVDQDRKHEG